MTSNKEQEVIAIDIQIIVSLVSIITILISISLLYNQKLDIKDDKTIFTAKETQKISEFNRDILLVIALAFLFVNIWLYNISKEEGEDLESYKLQIVASILTVIAALIALYVVRNPADRGQIVDVENPII